MGNPSQPDRELAAIAARQHGNVTRAQLVAAGLTRRQIDHRVSTGRLIRRHTGVYALGHVPLTPISRAAAAVLACGPGAALSHSSAAVLWGMLGHWQYPVEVTVTEQRRVRGIRIHRCTTLTREDITTHWGIRMTSPARTLLQLAPRLSDLSLARAYNDARLANFARPDDLKQILDRVPTHPGAHKLRPHLEIPGGPTRSPLEDRFIDFLRRYDLPLPHVNVRVEGFLVDAVYFEQRLIVELDSVVHHLDRRAFETDRERDATTTVAGFRTVRITDERLTTAPDREADRLRTLLSAAPAAPRSRRPAASPADRPPRCS